MVIVKNQIGIEIPMYMITIDKEIRINARKEINCKDETRKVHQSFIEAVFRLHKEKYGADHEANLCKSEDDVWRMYVKNRYLSTKNMIARKNGITILDMPEELYYVGAYIQTYPDKNGNIDYDDTDVKIYDVHPALDKGYQIIEFTLEEFGKLATYVRKFKCENGI